MSRWLAVVAVKDAHNVRKSQSGTWAYLEADVARKVIHQDVPVSTDASLPSRKDYSKWTFNTDKLP